MGKRARFQAGPPTISLALALAPEILKRGLEVKTTRFFISVGIFLLYPVEIG